MLSMPSTDSQILEAPTMKSLTRPIATAVGMVVCAALLSAAPVPKDTDEPVVDRKKYLPNREYQPRSGKVVGIAVSDVTAIMGRDGRSSQADALGFSSDAGSYNWMYVPMDDMPQITNLFVRVGEKGEEKVTYPKLGMATLKRIEPWGVKNAYTLVEVEVNDGKGAPADEAFVASKMTVVEGTKTRPLKVDDCVAKAKALYATYRKDSAKSLDDAMAKAMKDALGEAKATGPRETKEVLYLTWLTKEQRLVVAFQTTVTDGAYSFSPGGAFRKGLPGGNRPPPPPVGEGVRYGPEGGIEYGRRYEFDAKGVATGTKTLAVEGFKRVLPPPGP